MEVMAGCGISYCSSWDPTRDSGVKVVGRQATYRGREEVCVREVGVNHANTVGLQGAHGVEIFIAVAAQDADGKVGKKVCKQVVNRQAAREPAKPRRTGGLSVNTRAHLKIDGLPHHLSAMRAPTKPRSRRSVISTPKS
eukprot:scaffold1542_cov402-Prasinococcus_capsulatus_cf.AAC.5